MGFKVKKVGTKKDTYEYDVFPHSTDIHKVTEHGDLFVTHVDDHGDSHITGYGAGVWVDVIEGDWVQVTETIPTRQIEIK